ncbi:FeoA family protein [Anditalea andensis]|uniref:Ferrous iron transporter FeoA-like domain-containing protein n=1 Tax=Anditalea andensis TaxID=1048983 RepID=A0A074KX34_9BACT|nr:FeoA family protein [Anditalea andensis]KEO72133.1 hypothetical protein EL17_19680 [Anditalea andensis]
MTLDLLQVGQKAQLKSFIDSPLTLNFLEMGLTPGKNIEVIQKAPFNGPIALLMDNQTIAIRVHEAKFLQVSL